MEAFSLVTLAPLTWILWRTSFPLPPPSLKAARALLRPPSALGPEHSSPQTTSALSASQTFPEPKRTVFSLLTLAQSSNISQRQNHKLPERHSIRVNEHLPAAAGLPVVLHPWKLDTNESIPSSLHLSHSGQFWNK